MRSVLAALCALLLGCGAAATAAAQDADAFVLPVGTFRLSGGGEYARHDALRGASGSERLGSEFALPLVPASFPALRPLQTDLPAFLAATATLPGASPFAATEDDFSLGTPDLRYARSATRVPFRLEVGVAPRVQLGVMVPLVQGRVLVQRTLLDDPRVGINPDPDGNEALLGRISSAGSALGAGRYLPVEGSSAGSELQRRVFAATGDSLELPDTAGSRRTGLQTLIADELGLDTLTSGARGWRPGDVEIEARVLLLDQLGGVAVPSQQEGVGIRAALIGSLRLPTGARRDTVSLYPFEPDVGVPGFQLGAIADAFVGRRWWITAGGRLVGLGSVEVDRRATPTDAPLAPAQTARFDWSPADTVELRVAPRYRIAEIISIGGEYRLGWVGESTFSGSTEAVGGSVLPSGLTHSIGLGIRFNSLPAFADRRTRLPLDVSVAYSRTLGGPEGLAVQSGMRLSGSVYVSPWGRGMRP